MTNILYLPQKKHSKESNQNHVECKILEFKQKNDNGIMIDLTKYKKVHTLEEFFSDDDDVLFMG